MTRFHVAHLSYFSPETLAAVGRAAGYGVESIALSPDGGTITAIFRPQSDPQSFESCHAYQRIKDTLRGHTNLRYYASATPYLRMNQRLMTYLRSRRIARRFATGKELLDALYRDVRREGMAADQPRTP
jgi:hypothetical protein